MRFKFEEYLIKLILYFVLGIFLYFMFNIIDQFSTISLIAIIILSSLFFALIIFNFQNEKRYYKRLLIHMNEEVMENKLIIVYCPKCKSIQSTNGNICQICLAEWITCKECFQPFIDGESVLISPCCGYGFHPAHFESALRELGFCPQCQSIDVLMETNW